MRRRRGKKFVPKWSPRKRNGIRDRLYKGIRAEQWQKAFRLLNANHRSLRRKLKTLETEGAGAKAGPIRRNLEKSEAFLSRMRDQASKAGLPGRYWN